MSDNINIFAKTNFRGHEHRFGIKTDDRRRHMYVIGKTGMGKTTLLENLAIADIKSGKGVAIVDPHGDFAEKVLSFIPAQRINDVIYFNPSDIDHPIAFNVMEKVDLQYQHLIASGLIGVFKKIWADSWGPRLEYLLRNTILALLEYPGSTLLGVNRMLTDKEYRKKVISKVSDPVIRSFWQDEFTRYSSQFATEAISPIQNKVGQFLSNPMVRNIVGQTKSSIDIRKIMDDQKILIVNLSKGRIGEDYSALLGAMLITKIQLAAMSRVDIPEEERKDFYLYVDEFQNFATESFADILSEARKYRLDLTIAHQYVGQLEETVRDAVFGNVGTIVSFRVGAADAEILEKEFAPVFYITDIVNLGKYDIYLKLMIDGIAGDAFSATTLPSPEFSKDESVVEKIVQASRERYAVSKEVVEEKIARWASAETKQEPKKLEKRKVNSISKIVAEEGRKTWDAKCNRCGQNIQVPFKPDPGRDTYCKECLAQVRKEIATAMKKEPENNNNNNNKPKLVAFDRRGSQVGQADQTVKLSQLSQEETPKTKATEAKLEEAVNGDQKINESRVNNDVSVNSDRIKDDDGNNNDDVKKTTIIDDKKKEEKENKKENQSAQKGVVGSGEVVKF